MYATPVAFPLSFLAHGKYKSLVSLNPLSPIVELFRYALFGKGTFTTGSVLYSIVFTFCAMVIGLLVFVKVERTFMDTV
jgi:lipopolysaccharide transport system permease protein